MSDPGKDLIAVVEDNMPVRKLFCTILKKSGFDTVEFSDGASALEWLKGNTASAAIIDILLPDINGTDLYNAIRVLPNGDRLPIIAVTGFAKVSDREKFIGLGFDEYIPKPINTGTFADDIISVIKNKQA